MSDINLTNRLKAKMSAKSRVFGRYNSSEIYFIVNGLMTPSEWLYPKEKTMKEVLTMWGGIGAHNQIQDLLGTEFCEEKRVYQYKDFCVVGKVDFLPPHKQDEVWEFKTSERKMKDAKPWHLHQTQLYCTMFEKTDGVVYQPVQNDDGLYLKEIGRVHRDDTWFLNQMEKLHDFHIDVERLRKDEELPF